MDTGSRFMILIVLIRGSRWQIYLMNFHDNSHDIGFISLVRQEFRQGKSWKAICTSQIFDMLGAKEMRKRQ